MDDPLRILTYRFFDLRHATRIHLLCELGLYRDEDEGLQDFELFEAVLVRAKKFGLLAVLWGRVERSHADDKYKLNPFIQNSSKAVDDE
jgi:hypothetical protein